MHSPNSVFITIKQPLKDLRLEDVLDAIVNVADKPIKYTIENYGVMFSLKTGQETAALSTRRFKVDPDTFYKGLESASSHPVTRTNGRTSSQLCAIVSSASVWS